MNEIHLQQCASAEWAEMFAELILPWALTEMELGDDVLEVGPGPGVTTDGLRTHVRRLTAVEADDELATALAARLAGTNVEVIHADATNLPFENCRFSAAAAFTMLHHVPSPELQDRLLAEVARVLRPGGIFVGIDSADTPEWRELHVGDVCVPVDPATLGERLARVGFADSHIDTNELGFRFSARLPST